LVLGRARPTLGEGDASEDGERDERCGCDGRREGGSLSEHAFSLNRLDGLSRYEDPEAGDSLRSAL